MKFPRIYWMLCVYQLFEKSTIFCCLQIISCFQILKGFVCWVAKFPAYQKWKIRFINDQNVEKSCKLVVSKNNYLNLCDTCCVTGKLGCICKCSCIYCFEVWPIRFDELKLFTKHGGNAIYIVAFNMYVLILLHYSCSRIRGCSRDVRT